MNFVVRYTKQAEEDLFRNADWWAKNHSLDQALKWEAVIKEQLEALQQMPERHSLAPENSKFPFEIREKPIGLGSRPSYRAVYTIVESEVRLLAIRRSSQDVFTLDGDQ